MADYSKPPFESQSQPIPGSTDAMRPRPDHGEDSYKGSGRLDGQEGLITGGDCGIGRAVALAFAREGADLLVSYFNEDEDARETKRLVEAAGRQAPVSRATSPKLTIAAAIVARRSSSAASTSRSTTPPIRRARGSKRSATKSGTSPSRPTSHAMFYLTKAAVPHMRTGAPSSTRHP